MRRSSFPAHGLPRQTARCFWFTGLSGAGKSTIAHAVHGRLRGLGYQAHVLDGDHIRRGLCADLGFSPEDRHENMRRMGELCKLFHEAGIISLVAVIAPYAADRQRVREILGQDALSEIHVRCPLAVCEARDPKGNYARARRGLIPGYTGIAAPYEAPEQPDLILDTASSSQEECVEAALAHILPRIRPVGA